MKTQFAILFILVVPLSGLHAQSLQFVSATEPTPTPIDDDQTTWKHVVTYRTPIGKTAYRTNHYEQIGSGLNYWTENGWAPSRAEFELFENGAIARHGPNKLICAPNANSAPMLDVLAVDGKRFRTRVLGIVYAEPGPNGRSVLVAETQDSIGELDPSNPSQILYPEAFDASDGIHADLIIIYRKAGWEQNVVFRKQPPDPAEWGLQNASIELWTEQLFDNPEPVIHVPVGSSRPNARAGAEAVDPDADATELSFGGTTIGAGTAFLTGVGEAHGQSAATVPISKTWVQTPQQRRFLVEAAPFLKLRPLLSRLPETASLDRRTNEMLMASRSGVGIGTGSSPANRTSPLLHELEETKATSHPALLGRAGPAVGSPVRDASTPIAKAVPKAEFLARLPKLEFAATKPTEKIQLAKSDRSRKRGLAMDYSQYTVFTTLSNFTFKSSETYFIADQCDLTGTAVIESAVIKFTNATSSGHAKLYFKGSSVVCATDPAHPAVFCGKDDDAYGEQIAGSTHNPGQTTYGQHYLSLPTTGSLKVFHDIVLRNAAVAIYNPEVSNMAVDNAQFISCDFGVLNKENFTLRNALFYNTFRPFYGLVTNGVTTCEHLTVHNAGYLVYGTIPNVRLTNSLLISVTNGGRFDGANVETNLNPTGIFVSAGQGAHYLPALSPYRAAGNTNVSTNVLASLKMRTTTAPTILSNNVDAYPILSPVVPRGFTTAPDLGYAYFPADYVIQGVVLNTNTLLLTNGINVAVDCSFTNYGFLLGTNGTLISESDPLHLNSIVRTRSIQESPVVDKTGSATFAEVNTTVLNAGLRLRFTDLPLQPGDYHVNDPDNSTAFREISFKDCQFRGGYLYLSQNSATNFTFDFLNNLFERVGIQIYPYSLGGAFQARNNLFFGGSLSLIPTNQGMNYVFYDNLFDKTGISLGGATNVVHNFNGYLTNFDRLTPTTSSTNDVVLTNSTVGYKTNFLSSYYLPTNSLLGHAGSQAANYSGLYWYCAKIDQVPETNSQVSISWHHVALGTNNLPLDGDGDLLASYYEDRNGNGLKDDGETDSANADTDGDGISDFLERILGGNPLVAAARDTNGVVNLRVYTPLK